MDLAEFDNRFLSSFVLGSLDYDAQLYAIHDLLRRHRQAQEELAKEIGEIDAFARRSFGIANQQAIDDWVDHLHHSVFQDAAQSMAAVGMLAPFIESVFKRAFPRIIARLERHGGTPNGQVRSVLPERRRWDCQYATPNRKDLVGGIMEMAEATGLAGDLPPDLKPTLMALFAYRNKMFHNGFEWPDSDRTAFAERISEEGWPVEWFSQATSDGRPWVFYVTDAFVVHCLVTVEQILDGLGAFVRRHD